MGITDVKARKEVDLNLVDLQKLPRTEGVRIEVTKDLDTSQISLEYHCQGKSYGEPLVFEGDAVVIEGNNVEWVVDPETNITKIEIEPDFRISRENIWNIYPHIESKDPLHWIGTVKNLPSGSPDFVEQSYFLHYWIDGCLKRRTIDPIIRVNK